MEPMLPHDASLDQDTDVEAGDDVQADDPLRRVFGEEVQPSNLFTSNRFDFHRALAEVKQRLRSAEIVQRQLIGLAFRVCVPFLPRTYGRHSAAQGPAVYPPAGGALYDWEDCLEVLTIFNRIWLCNQSQPPEEIEPFAFQVWPDGKAVIGGAEFTLYQVAPWSILPRSSRRVTSSEERMSHLSNFS
jgi:hypothetical protein